MSNQPKTPHRTIRVGGSLWEQAQAKATAEGTTVSAVIRAALERYAKDDREGGDWIAHRDRWLAEHRGENGR